MTAALEPEAGVVDRWNLFDQSGQSVVLHAGVTPNGTDMYTQPELAMPHRRMRIPRDTCPAVSPFCHTLLSQDEYATS